MIDLYSFSLRCAKRPSLVGFVFGESVSRREIRRTTVIITPPLIGRSATRAIPALNSAVKLNESARYLARCRRLLANAPILGSTTSSKTLLVVKKKNAASRLNDVGTSLYNACVGKATRHRRIIPFQLLDRVAFNSLVEIIALIIAPYSTKSSLVIMFRVDRQHVKFITLPSTACQISRFRLEPWFTISAHGDKRPLPSRSTSPRRRIVERQRDFPRSASTRP